MRLRLLAPISLLAAALVCSTAIASPGRLIKKSVEGGTPIAYARGYVTFPRHLIVRVKADPALSMEVLWNVTCAKGAKGKFPAGEFIAQAPLQRKLRKGFKRPDNCTVDVQAAYADARQTGAITIELYARR
jgi:hypothetical protein